MASEGTPCPQVGSFRLPYKLFGARDAVACYPKSMDNRRSRGEQNELTAVILSCHMSYTIADHRPRVARIDDEAIVDIETSVESNSDGYQSVLARNLRVSVCCSQSYEEDGKGAQSFPPLASLNLSKAGMSALLYLPCEAFWGLQPLLIGGHFSKVSLIFGKSRYGTAEVSSFSLQE